MKIISENDTMLLLRFDKREEIISELAVFCKNQNIPAASFTALGAASEVTLSFYNLPEKRYKDHSLQEHTEIVSVTGDVARMKDETIIHAHGVFAKQDLTTIGGHIKKLVVSATCEITLWKLGSKVERQFDPETGLNLLT